MSRVSKGVSFNVSDAYEARLFEYAMTQGAFSKLVKRLIAKEMEGGQVAVKRPVVEDSVARPMDDVSSFV